ncbi:hypothetical protein AWENTII_008654 [Aspergillus wentii]
MFKRSLLSTARHVQSPRIQPRIMSTRAKSCVTPVHTDKSYKPFAHYSQAIRSPGHVWLSGQIPADANGKLIKGSITDQTQTIIQNTDNLLQEAGSSLENVVKVVMLVLCPSSRPSMMQLFRRNPHGRWWKCRICRLGLISRWILLRLFDLIVDRVLLDIMLFSVDWDVYSVSLKYRRVSPT